jgi:putative redox protein
MAIFGTRTDGKTGLMQSKQFIGTAEASNSGAEFTTCIKSQGFEFLADEAFDVGGNNLGPAPGDYLCMALASCKAMTLRMYVQRKQWKVDVIHVKVSLVKGNQMASGLNTFHAEINVTGTVNEEQMHRMQYIAKACPIGRLLLKQNEVLTTLTLNKSPANLC